MGVDPPGVNKGVPCPGVVIECGVMLGVIEAPDGVIDGVAADGVSSHRERRFDAPGVESMIESAPRSALGVSIQPELCPGVSRSVFGVSSQRLRRVDFSWAGVSRPGVVAWWAGVASQILALGVAPGVSLPLWPGVSSQRWSAGVFCFERKRIKFKFWKVPETYVWIPSWCDCTGSRFLGWNKLLVNRLIPSTAFLCFAIWRRSCCRHFQRSIFGLFLNLLAKFRFLAAQLLFAHNLRVCSWLDIWSFSAWKKNEKKKKMKQLFWKLFDE